MHYEPQDAKEPLGRLARQADGLLQKKYRQDLLALNLQLLELLQPKPDFHAFIEYELSQQFTALAPTCDPERIFIESRAADAPLPDSTFEAAQLLPSLLDAVVQRIVEAGTASYAKRQTRFLCASAGKEQLEEASGITAVDFDGFLDRVAGALDTHYAQFLQQHWEKPAGLSSRFSRKQQLIARHAEQLAAIATLQRVDGGLGPVAETLVNRVLRYPDAATRQTALRGYRPCVYSLALKDDTQPDMRLHGAFVMTARDQADSDVERDTPVRVPSVRPVAVSANVGVVVLFTPNRGLEEFDSLASLDLELHRRMKAASSFNDLLTLLADKDQVRGLALHQAGRDAGQVHYGEWLGSMLDASVQAHFDKALLNFASMVARYRAVGVNAETVHLPASLDRVTDLEPVFDAETLLQAREARRVQAQLELFLQDALPADKEAWRSALQAYRVELLEEPEPQGLPSIVQFGDLATLQAYGNEQLRIVLQAEHGLDVNPDTINVHTKRPRVPPGSYSPGATPVRPDEGPRYITSSRSLTDLALENVGGLDFNFTNFSTLTDKDDKPYPDLTTQQVKDLVRQVNICDKYDQFLRDHLLTSTAAIAQKERFIRLMSKQMLLDAIEAKISGDFLADRLDRGFSWVKAVLKTPEDTDQRDAVEGHRIIVTKLMLRNARVRGVLVFRTASNAVASRLVYAPQAPSGRLFYEYASEPDMLRDFIGNSSLREYLVERVDLAHQKSTRVFLHGHIDGSLVNLARIADDFLEEQYLSQVSAAINNADVQSTSTHETNVRTAVTIGETVVDIAMMLLPVKIMVPIGLARSLIALINGIEAANLGERSEAAQHFVRAFAYLVGTAADTVVGFSSAPATVAKSAGLNPKMALAKKPDGVVPFGTGESRGIYVKEPSGSGARQYFLNDEGHWYSVRYDNDVQTWRVRDGRKPFSYHDAPIEHVYGQWQVQSPTVGLKGGRPPEEQLIDLYPTLNQAQARRALDSFRFPQGREVEFELSLIHHIRAGQALPNELKAFLVVDYEQFLSRLHNREVLFGLLGEQPPGPSSAPVTTPARPPVPVVSPAPVAPASSVETAFLSWGQDIGPQVQPVAGTSIYQAKVPSRAGRHTEYVRLGERYFEMLPTDGNVRANTQFIRDPGRRATDFDNYERFESLLKNDLSAQPRAIVLDTQLSTWLVNSQLLFRHDLASYVGKRFPLFDNASQRMITKTLFGKVIQGRMGGRNLVELQRTLRDWRDWSAVPQSRIAEPLMLLETTAASTTSHWSVGGGTGGPLRVLRIRYERGSLFMRNALTYPETWSLRALMQDLIKRIGYEVLSTLLSPTDLIFRRRGHATVYCMNLQRTFTSNVPVRDPTSLNVGLLPPAAQGIVTAAQQSGNLVHLVGGIQQGNTVSVPRIFIIRVWN
jgi:hypothetical protein